MIQYLVNEAKKLPRAVHYVRVWWETPGGVRGYDVQLASRVIMPLGRIPDDQVDWMINLKDNNDFDRGGEYRVSISAIGPIVTP